MKVRSKFEKTVLDDLNSRKKKFKYESMEIAYTLHKNYIPDLVLPNGIVVELKGKFPKDQRDKMLAVKEQYPDLDIRMVFMSLKARLPDAKKRKDGTYMSCEEWAIKYKWVYAEKCIPESWFRG